MCIWSLILKKNKKQSHHFFFNLKPQCCYFIISFLFILLYYSHLSIFKNFIQFLLVAIFFLLFLSYPQEPLSYSSPWYKSLYCLCNYWLPFDVLYFFFEEEVIYTKINLNSGYFGTFLSLVACNINGYLRWRTCVLIQIILV